MTTEKTKQEYTEASGRRKTSVARVRLFEDKKNSFSINDKTLEEYFPKQQLRNTVEEVFKESEIDKKFFVSVLVKGGGLSSQAEAIRHGIARILTEIDPDLRPRLKKAGFLKRDPRRKERKKFGLKKSRKAPQWSKR
jgi:small subunit ribosomal protein S9